MTTINFREHFELQDRLNRVINPDWLTAGYRWSDAAMVEAVEAFDHLAWKWWKAGTDNMPQFRLELVDIWHFLLSATLENVPKNNVHGRTTDPVEYMYERWATHQRGNKSSGTLQQTLRIFIALCAIGKAPIGTFFRLCELADLSLPELDRMYRAKGVLNLFRQANGYKDGTYVKQWAGREDNVWLDAIMATTPAATADELMDQLSRIYHDVLSGATETTIAARALVNNIRTGAAALRDSAPASAQEFPVRDPEIGFVALGVRSAEADWIEQQRIACGLGTSEGCGKYFDKDRGECGGSCDCGRPA